MKKPDISLQIRDDRPVTGFGAIPFEYFENFHKDFHGDTWDICQACGGKCEINKIGALLPGETEYIAAKMKEDPGRFRRKYLDALVVPEGTVDVLKLKPGCPFLDGNYKCTIKDFKPILCDIYPLVFEVKDLEVDIFLDTWCPMVRQADQELSNFSRKGFEALKDLPIPLKWWQAVGRFDSLCVDYEKMLQLRADNDYICMDLHEIIQHCLAEEEILPEFGVKPVGLLTYEHD